MVKDITEMFIMTIEEGLKAVKGITDPAKKAEAYAQLGQALALTNKVGTSQTTAITTDKIGKDALADIPKKKKESKEEPKKKVKQEIKKEIKEEVKEEPKEEEIDETWTEQAVARFKDDITTLNKFKQSYGEEAVTDAVSMFSEKVLKSLNEITPLNIQAFVTFLKKLEEDVN